MSKAMSKWVLSLVVLLFCSALLIALGATSSALATSFTAVTPIAATSGINSGDAPNAIDGDTGTIWQAAADPEACITFDLGSIEQVIGIRETSGAFPANPFTAFVSTDGVGFTQVASGTLTQSSFGDHFFSSVAAQFLKLCIQRTDATGFGELAEFQALVSAVIMVDIDIKPGSDPNCFNSDGHGAIPVAILSSAAFDATQVDPTTISLDGQEVRVVGKGNTQDHNEDVNSDGLDDLVVQIEDEDETYEVGDTVATLTGTTIGGTSIEGADSICIVQ